MKRGKRGAFSKSERQEVQTGEREKREREGEGERERESEKKSKTIATAINRWSRDRHMDFGVARMYSTAV